MGTRTVVQEKQNQPSVYRVHGCPVSHVYPAPFTAAAFFYAAVRFGRDEDRAYGLIGSGATPRCRKKIVARDAEARRRRAAVRPARLILSSRWSRSATRMVGLPRSCKRAVVQICPQRAGTSSPRRGASFAPTGSTTSLQSWSATWIFHRCYSASERSSTRCLDCG